MSAAAICESCGATETGTDQLRAYSEAGGYLCRSCAGRMQTREITIDELQLRIAATRKSKWEGCVYVVLEVLCLILIVAFVFRK